MTTFGIRLVSSYSWLVVCSAFNVASRRRKDYVLKYFSGNLTVRRSTKIKQGSYTIFSFLLFLSSLVGQSQQIIPPPGSGVVCEFILKIPQALFHVLQFGDLPVQPSGVSGALGKRSVCFKACQNSCLIFLDTSGPEPKCIDCQSLACLLLQMSIWGKRELSLRRAHCYTQAPLEGMTCYKP